MKFMHPFLCPITLLFFIVASDAAIAVETPTLATPQTDVAQKEQLKLQEWKIARTRTLASYGFTAEEAEKLVQFEQQASTAQMEMMNCMNKEMHNNIDKPQLDSQSELRKEIEQKQEEMSLLCKAGKRNEAAAIHEAMTQTATQQIINSPKTPLQECQKKYFVIMQDPSMAELLKRLKAKTPTQEVHVCDSMKFHDNKKAAQSEGAGWAFHGCLDKKKETISAEDKKNMEEWDYLRKMEVNDLCYKGNHQEADKKQREWALKISKTQSYAALRDCAEIYKNMFNQKNLTDLNNKINSMNPDFSNHICDFPALLK
jgi:hypothetical protein